MAYYPGLISTLKITDIHTFHCSDGSRNIIFVQVVTDDAISGYGEPYTIGPDESVLGMIESIKPWSRFL